jgi:phosphoribosylformylglycinamidine synthase
VRQATYTPEPQRLLNVPSESDCNSDLSQILGSLNVASKQWVIRQYDHEVQGGSVVKPLVGVNNDGPSDAAVLRPRLESRRGIVVACGMNPYYGELDTYHMAASAIDEAVRNCVAVGADPRRIAILDNFCWGDCEKSETLGALVRAALACYDVAVGLGTPFISGKDSLNNEFSYVDDAGQRHTIAIPPTLLISALGQVADVGRCVTMDLKSPGNYLYQVGATHDELGGSHYAMIHGLNGGTVPKVDVDLARSTFAALHEAIDAGLVRACHDLSEGGLAVTAAEMAFAGDCGANIDLGAVPCALPDIADNAVTVLFSESNTRFLCEVTPTKASQFEHALGNVPTARIGEVTDTGRLRIGEVIDADINDLKEAWLAPLRW